jgi:hypothetical protein
MLGANKTFCCDSEAIDAKADNVVINLGGYTITGTGSDSGVGINGPNAFQRHGQNGRYLKVGKRRQKRGYPVLEG